MNTQTKKTVSYNVDKEVSSEFDKLAKANSLNKSQWIENKIREYLKEHGKEVLNEKD